MLIASGKYRTMRLGDSAHLFAALEEKVDRVVAVCDRRADDWQPMEHLRRQRPVSRLDLYDKSSAREERRIAIRSTYHLPQRVNENNNDRDIHDGEDGETRRGWEVGLRLLDIARPVICGEKGGAVQRHGERHGGRQRGELSRDAAALISKFQVHSRVARCERNRTTDVSCRTIPYKATLRFSRRFVTHCLLPPSRQVQLSSAILLYSPVPFSRVLHALKRIVFFLKPTGKCTR